MRHRLHYKKPFPYRTFSQIPVGSFFVFLGIPENGWSDKGYIPEQINVKVDYNVYFSFEENIRRIIDVEEGSRHGVRVVIPTKVENGTIFYEPAEFVQNP